MHRNTYQYIKIMQTLVAYSIIMIIIIIANISTVAVIFKA